MPTLQKKILLIDDEEVILFGFIRVLSEPGLAIDGATTVEEAMRLAEQNVYAAAVVDLRLSSSMVMEGFYLIPYLKSIQANCRIIVLTAYCEDSIRHRAIEAGADLFLEKPVDPKIIKENLKAMGIY